MHAPLLAGALTPGDDPHHVAFVESKYADGRPDAHAQTLSARLAVGTPDGTWPPSQYKPGLEARDVPQVSPAPATLAPVTASRMLARAQPMPRSAQASRAACQVKLSL
jgi:hypothetical protein